MDLDKEFLKAVKDGDFKGAMDLYEQGADIYYNDDQSLTIACDRGHTELVKFLLDKHCSVDAWNGSSLTEASRKGHTEIVELLLAKNADVQANDNSALNAAAGNGQTDIVKLLISHGADVHADNDGALTFAVDGGKTEAVKTLLENGANIKAINNNHIYDLATKNDVDTFKLLVIDYNIPIDKDVKAFIGNFSKDCLDILEKRDLNIKLNSNIKPKQDKAMRMKI